MELEQKKNKVWNIVKIVLNVFFYSFIALLVIFSISNISNKTETSIPNIFGRGYLVPQSDSMTGKDKDSFTQKDLIFVKVINDKNRDKVINSLEVGDIITFEASIEGLGSKLQLNTHRIKEIHRDTNGKVYQFTTQGDKARDLNNSQVEEISVARVKAVYTGKWNGAGTFFNYLLNPKGNGFLLCVVLPTAAFFIFEIIMLILNFIKVQQAKTYEKLSETKSKTEEELKEELRRQIMAEMAQANTNNKEEK